MCEWVAAAAVAAAASWVVCAHYTLAVPLYSHQAATLKAFSARATTVAAAESLPHAHGSLLAVPQVGNVTCMASASAVSSGARQASLKCAGCKWMAPALCVSVVLNDLWVAVGVLLKTLVRHGAATRLALLYRKPFVSWYTVATYAVRLWPQFMAVDERARLMCGSVSAQLLQSPFVMACNCSRVMSPGVVPPGQVLDVGVPAWAPVWWLWGVCVSTSCYECEFSVPESRTTGSHQ